MDFDPDVDLDELERQWDVSLEAAESALDDWYQDDSESEADGLIEVVLRTQREQRERFQAVREHRKLCGSESSLLAKKMAGS
jgi:hypothetical protein